MATINLSSTFQTTNTNSDLVATGKGSINYTATGDKGISANQSVTSSWVMVNTGSLTSVKYIFVKNIGSGSQLAMAQDASGANKFALLNYNDFVVLPPSSSQGYWVKVNTNVTSSIAVVAGEI